MGTKKTKEKKTTGKKGVNPGKKHEFDFDYSTLKQLPQLDKMFLRFSCWDNNSEAELTIMEHVDTVPDELREGAKEHLGIEI